MKMYRVLGIIPGSYSGVRSFLFRELAKKHYITGLFNSKLSKPLRYYNHFKSYIQTAIILRDLPSHPNQWLQLTDKNRWRWIKETERCEKNLNNKKEEIDFILQIGSKCGPYKDKPKIPYIIYTDGTNMVTERNYPVCRLWPSVAERNSRIRLEAKLYQNARAILTFSKLARDSVISDYGINKNKVATVYAGANIKNTPSYINDDKYDNKTILFIGKDFEIKGGPTLIKAFKEVKKQIKDVKLIIAGPEVLLPNYSRINTFTNLFGVNIVKEKYQYQDIEFIGYMDSERIGSLFNEASVFVMPSVQENFGHVFLEAMAYNTPCVGSTSGGIPEIIKEDKTGYLVPPGNYKELAEKLILLLEDEKLMQRMGRKGRRIMEKKFTWDLVAKRMEKYFEKIC